MNEKRNARSKLWQKFKLQWFFALNAYDNWRSNLSIFKIATFILIITLVWIVFPEKEIAQPPGILAPLEPQRSPVPNALPFTFKKYSISPLQEYELTARILAKKSYFLFDKAADIAPLDMVFGWGLMSDSSVLDHMNFSIMNRFYRYHYDSSSPLSRDQIEPYLDNNHLIPATGTIENTMRSGRIGELVHLKGYLVSISRPDGYNWTSSMSIGSSGDSVLSCKLIYVTQFEILK